LTTVQIRASAQKDIEKVPYYIQDKLYLWIQTVSEFGIMKARQSKGFHDEPLKGKRRNQRSIRLNRSYRAIYIEEISGEIELIEIIEVNKHDY
jgi:proteic killer suppression protein